VSLPLPTALFLTVSVPLPTALFLTVLLPTALFLTVLLPTAFFWTVTVLLPTAFFLTVSVPLPTAPEASNTKTAAREMETEKKTSSLLMLMESATLFKTNGWMFHLTAFDDIFYCSYVLCLSN
jgi:hypothetical protein